MPPTWWNFSRQWTSTFGNCPMTKHAVVCPWAEEHSTEGSDTSTVIFEPSEGRGWAFKCLHSHCAGRNLQDVLQKLGIPDPDSSLKNGSREARNFQPVTAEQLLAERPDPLIWTWDLYLPEGSLALVAAFMKIGKSTFTYALALAVARGEPFLNSATKQGGVLILAVEEHRRDAKLRLGEFGLLASDPIHLHVGPLDNTPATLAAVRTYIVQHGIVLVLLDTLSRFWGVEAENDNAAVDRAVAPLLQLARDTGVTVLLVHHERKAGGEEGRSIRGGSALFGLVDQALILERRPGGNTSQRILRAIGRYSETPSEVVLDYHPYKYRLLGAIADVDREAQISRVWAVLSNKPQTIPAIAEAAALTERQARGLLQLLEEQGRLIRGGGGVKNDPYSYRRAASDSFPADSHPKGKGKNRTPAKQRTKPTTAVRPLTTRPPRSRPPPTTTPRRPQR